MLKIESTRILNSARAPLASTVASIQEGVLCVAVMEAGQMCAKPSVGGVATEIVIGIAMSQVMNPAVAPKVEQFQIPASGTYAVTLAKTPLNPTTAVGLQLTDKNGVVLSAGVYTAPPTATTHFAISGKTLTMHSADASAYITVTYTYAPTLAEAAMIYGQGIGDAGQSTINSVSLITDAEVVYTDQYDPTDNWSAGGKVYAGAGGILTLKAGSTNTSIPGCHVVSAPSIASGGFLGVYFTC